VTDVRAHAAELESRGFTVLPAVYPESVVRTLRAALEAEYDRAGRPEVIADGHLVDKGSDTAATAAGFAVRQILKTRPELAPILLEPDTVAVLRAALGDDMVLELAGGLLSDASRPFFKWHNHVGGIDDHRWEGRTDYPRSGRPVRVLVLVYLQPITPSLGSVLVLPRKPDDPIAAPGALDALSWEGQHVIEAPAGTAVLIEQTTWHAALPQTAPGLRMFMGFYFASSSAPPGPGTDDALLALDTDVPLLRSVLPKR
jgi:hypothetical protein